MHACRRISLWIARIGLLAGLWSAGGAVASEMPRLAGVVIAPGERIALFDTGSGVLLTVDEGGVVAGYRVRLIDRSGVEIEQNGQVTLLHTSAMAGLASPAAAVSTLLGQVPLTLPAPDD